MNQKHDKKGRFTAKYTDKDMDKFVEWVKEEKDANWIMGKMMMEYNISPMTAYNWLERACKIAG